MDQHHISAGLYGNPSIVLHEDGYPHVSYVEHIQESSGEVDNLIYAYQDKDGWQFSTVDRGGGDVGGYASLAFDKLDNPHISYYDALNNDLKYAYKDSGSWHTQTVDQEKDVGTWTSLALDDIGDPHISYAESIYCDGGYGGDYVCGSFIKYAFQNIGGWQTQKLDMRYLEDGMETSLALDVEGFPHISYAAWNELSEWELSELKYAYLDVSGWHTQTMVLGEDGAWGSSLALDNDGYPHIGYIYGGSLYYTFQDAGGRNFQMVDGEAGSGVSLRLDAAGSPHISYSGGDSNDLLKYAYQQDGVWQTQTVDQYERWIATSLALDNDGFPQISYIVASEELRYANMDATGWYTQTVDTGLSGSSSTSLALDQDGMPHICYKKDSGLMYTYSMGEYETVYLPLVMK